MTVIGQHRADPAAVPFRIAQAPRLATVREAPDWSRAACRGLPTELFYPGQGDDRTARAAREICAVCPIRAECLDYAIGNAERFGIWGGMTEHDRRVERRSRGLTEGDDL